MDNPDCTFKSQKDTGYRDMTSGLYNLLHGDFTKIAFCILITCLFLVVMASNRGQLVEDNMCTKGYCKDEVEKSKEANPDGIGQPTIFSKIIDRSSPAEIIYEDDLCIAFNGNAPKAPVHFLVIPKKLIPRLQDAEDGDEALLGHLMTTVRKVAKQQGLNEDGYRVVINNGYNGAQAIFHMHIHVFGGRQMGWPPG